MARVSVKALFGRDQIKRILDSFQSKIEEKIVKSMIYIGEDFINKARLNGNYTDRTGNLRSSIGYIIVLNGHIAKRKFIGKSKGKNQGLKAAEKVARQYPDGYILIGVAGMNYAAYVEAKNFDVITGSVPEKELLKSILREI